MQVVRIHSLVEALELQSRHRDGTKIVALSPPYAPTHMGIGIWQEIIRQAEWDGHADIIPVLDCGDRTGDALDAVARGVGRILFSGPPETVLKLQSLAAKQNVQISAEIKDLC